MSAAAFCLLVLNVLGTPKPKFAQLASSVFGLFYCGTTASRLLALSTVLCAVQWTSSCLWSIIQFASCCHGAASSAGRQPVPCSIRSLRQDRLVAGLMLCTG